MSSIQLHRPAPNVDACNTCALDVNPLLLGHPWVGIVFGRFTDAVRLQVKLAEAGFSPHPQHSALMVCDARGRLDQVARDISRVAAALALTGVRMGVVDSATLPPAVDFMHELEDADRVLQRLGARWLIPLLQHGALEMHFQPIMDGRGRLVAEEALIRARLDDGHLVLGSAIMDAARALRIQVPLDGDLRAMALRRFAGAAPSPRVQAFINFSPAAIHDPERCLGGTLEELRRVGLRPDRVVFEVVECDRVDDVDHLARIFAHCRAQGCRVALDDFGAGSSCMRQLLTLQPDVVKLDRALVHSACGSQFGMEVLRAVVEASQRNHVQVLAEGIETPEQFARMRACGVTLFQGFLLGRPRALPARAALPA